MVRAVLDVNVIVSAIINSYGNPRRCWRAWQDGRFALIASAHIILETTTKLRLPRIARRYGVSEADAFLVEAALSNRATLVELAAGDIVPVTGDPEDDAVLATALLGGADYLVTGDGGLRDYSPYEGIEIVTPRVFLERLDTDQVDMR